MHFPLVLWELCLLPIEECVLGCHYLFTLRPRVSYADQPPVVTHRLVNITVNDDVWTVEFWGDLLHKIIVMITD